MSRKFHLKPEDQLLLNCSISNISDAEIRNINKIMAMNLDWDYLVEMAKKHRLTSLMYWQLNKICPEQVPIDVKRNLQLEFQSNVHRNLAMFSELLKIIDILQKEGITPIPYKGPVLAMMAYNNLGFRSFGDLDFYVPWEDVPRARKILIENGYEPLMKLTSHQEKAFYKYQREYHFINKSKSVILEIKWKFLSTLHYIDENSFLKSPNFFKEVDLDQFKVKTISPEYLLLILSVHNATHFFSSLYRFCDLSELIRSMEVINWQNLMEIADEIDIKRILLINMHILRELFGIELPDNVVEEIDNDQSVDKISQEIIQRFFSKKSIGKFRKLVFPLKIRARYSNKLRDFFATIFLPTPEVIDSVSLPLALQPIYYILRIFQILKT